MNTQHAFTIVTALAMSGCYLKPMSSTPPVQTQEGVRVGLAGEDCEDHIGAEGKSLTRSLDVKLSIYNPTPEALRFSPSAIHLSADEWSATPLGTTSVQVAPGQTRDVVVAFLHPSQCDNDFTIAFGEALTLGEQRLAVANVRFNPLGRFRR